MNADFEYFFVHSERNKHKGPFGGADSSVPRILLPLESVYVSNCFTTSLSHSTASGPTDVAPM